ncbi:MAG TPA: molecular chaperone TorD family protein [Bacteroidales bacterium]|nr:molecular chaperone TorD family protein [Bacteroidales bacterium]
MDINIQNNVLKGYNMLLYFAGSMIMFEPNEECITDFWTKGILKSLPVSSNNPNFIKASSLLRDSCQDSGTLGNSMHDDYARLFASNGSALAPAYESLYRNNVRAGKYDSDTVTDFYGDYGWHSRFKENVSDDHLGVELLFLTLMIEQYTELDDEACRGEMRNEIRRFINKHILSWIPEWNKDVQVHAKTLSFKGVGTLILACIEDILSIIAEGEPEPAAKNFKN